VWKNYAPAIRRRRTRRAIFQPSHANIIHGKSRHKPITIRILGQVFGLVGVSGFEIEAGKDGPAYAADQFLESGPIAVAAFLGQLIVGLDHESAPIDCLDAQ